MNVLSIAPWHPPAPSAEHLARCAALGLDPSVDVRSVDVGSAGAATAWAKDSADLHWIDPAGARHSLVEDLRARGALPPASPGSPSGGAVASWSLSPSGRTLFALAGSWRLPISDRMSVYSPRLYAVDLLTGATETLEPDAAGFQFVGVGALDDDTILLVAHHAARLVKRTPEGFRDLCREAIADTTSFAFGVCEGRPIALLASLYKTTAIEASSGALEVLGAVLCSPWRVAVRDDAAVLALAPRSMTAFHWEVREPDVTHWRVGLAAPAKAKPVKAKPAKAPKASLRLVEHPEIALARGVFVRDLAALHTAAPRITFEGDDAVLVDGRRVARPGRYGSFSCRGRWLWCVLDARVLALDLGAADDAWRPVLPQCIAPSAVIGLDDDTAVVWQDAFIREKQGGLMLCRRDAQGVWQTLHRIGIGQTAFAAAHPTRPLCFVLTSNNLALYGVVNDALKKLDATSLVEEATPVRMLLHGDGARVWVGRAFPRLRREHETQFVELEWLREVLVE